jgi:hypothetical protein
VRRGEKRRGETSTVQGENRASDYNSKNAYRVWVAKPDRRPLGKPRRNWENNIKMLDWEEHGSGLNEWGCGYGQVVGCCEGGNESLGTMKCGEFLD